MHPQFTELTPRWFKRAFIYTGSIGEFRYRFNNDAKENVIHAAVYSQLCYELAADVAEQDFPWDDDGVEALKASESALEALRTEVGAARRREA